MDEYKLHKQFKELLTKIITATDRLMNDRRVNDEYDANAAEDSLHNDVQQIKKWIQDIFYLDKELLKYDLEEERALKRVEAAISHEQAEEFAKHHRFNHRIDHHAAQLESYLDLLLSKSQSKKLRTIMFNVLQNASAFRVLVNHELSLDERLRKHFEVIEEIAEKYRELL